MDSINNFLQLDQQDRVTLVAGKLGVPFSENTNRLIYDISAKLTNDDLIFLNLDRHGRVTLQASKLGVPFSEDTNKLIYAIGAKLSRIKAATASAEKKDDPDWRQLIKKHPRWRAGFRQLNFAVWEGLTDIVKLMLRDDHLGPSDYDNDLALHDAVRYEHGEIVRMLLADGRFDPTIDRYYAVVVAAEKESRADILEALCTDNRVNVQVAIKRAKKDGYPRSMTDRLRKYIF